MVMTPEFALSKLNELQNITKTNLIKIASINNTIDPITGLSHKLLLGKALSDMLDSGDNGFILPMLTNEFEPSQPFTTAITIPCSNESIAIGCALNCNHIFGNDFQEANEFSITLVNLGSLLVQYAGDNLVSKNSAGYEMPMPEDANPTL